MYKGEVYVVFFCVEAVAKLRSEELPVTLQGTRYPTASALQFLANCL